jgi:hypothetical protein
MWCSAGINVIFNMVKPLFIISERTAKMNDDCRNAIDVGKLFQIIWGELYENYHYKADFYFKLRIIMVF